MNDLVPYFRALATLVVLGFVLEVGHAHEYGEGEDHGASCAICFVHAPGVAPRTASILVLSAPAGQGESSFDLDSLPRDIVLSGPLPARGPPSRIG